MIVNHFRNTSRDVIILILTLRNKIHFSLRLLLIVQFSIITIQCGLDIEDPTPPSPLAWVQKSFPEEWPETGVDAHEDGGIFLEWEPPIDEGVDKFDLYRSQGLVSDSIEYLEFEFLASIPASDGVFDYRDQQAERNNGYYYYIIATDQSGNKSEPSDTLFYYSMEPVKFSAMRPVGTTDSLIYPFRLHWIYPVEVAMETYTLTILTNEGDVCLRTVLVPLSYVSDMEYYEIQPGIDLDGPGIYSWRIDCNARYEAGVETYGSESKWAKFTFVEYE
jgi:hypothetical protein